MTRMKQYIKDSEDTVGGDPTNNPYHPVPPGTDTRTPSPSGSPHFDEGKILKYMNEKKNDVYVGGKVKVLQGKYKGKSGKVVDYSLEDDQIDVKMPDNKEIHLGFDDVKVEG